MRFPGAEQGGLSRSFPGRGCGGGCGALLHRPRRRLLALQRWGANSPSVPEGRMGISSPSSQPSLCLSGIGPLGRVLFVKPGRGDSELQSGLYCCPFSHPILAWSRPPSPAWAWAWAWRGAGSVVPGGSGRRVAADTHELGPATLEPVGREAPAPAVAPRCPHAGHRCLAAGPLPAANGILEKRTPGWFHGVSAKALPGPERHESADARPALSSLQTPSLSRPEASECGRPVRLAQVPRRRGAVTGWLRGGVSGEMRLECDLGG